MRNCHVATRPPCVSKFLQSVVVLLILTGSAQSQVSPGDKIGEGVASAVQTSGIASVMIALSEDAGGPTVTAPLSSIRASVASRQDNVLSQLAATGFVLNRRFKHVAALAGRITNLDAIEALRAHPGVLKVDLDVGGSGTLDESIPIIGADRWHNNGVTGFGSVVAILDTGVDTSHPDLVSSIVNDGACFIDTSGSSGTAGTGHCVDLANPGDPYCDATLILGQPTASGLIAVEDDQGHGTHVSGIVTSDDPTNMGVAPDADVILLKVLDCRGGAGFFYTFADIVAALDEILGNPGWGVNAINMSLSTGAEFVGDCDAATAWTIPGAAAIDLLRANGVIAFAAAGNTASTTSMGAPACLSNVVAVGASGGTDATKNDAAGFSSVSLTTDIFAPGDGITSTQRGGGYVTFSGTSMASPTAAGCAALLFEEGSFSNPDDIEGYMESSPDLVTAGNGLDYPRLDCGQAALPVELVTFRALVRSNGVALEWATDTETDNAGFEIQRREEIDGEWRVVSVVVGAGTTLEPQSYRYVDRTVPAGGDKLYYRLKMLDLDGSFSYSSIVEIAPDMPSRFELHANYPNPFNPSTLVSYDLPVSSSVMLTVFDALGREVVQLVNEEKAAGRHVATFDATALPSGVYLYRLEASGFSQTRRMLLTK